MQKVTQQKKQLALINKVTRQIQQSSIFRQRIASSSHLLFLSIYFPHYLTSPLAWFHYEMLNITEDEKIKLAAIMAFRGSGKSTIMNLSFSLWAILGKLNKKFILVISRKHKQSKAHFENIRQEWQNNSLLRNDFGFIKIKRESNGAKCISFEKLEAKIMMLTTQDSLRGLRSGKYRPDLIICDDLEDSASTKSYKEREKLYQWFMNEVLPCGSEQTKIIILGNLLHKDSLLLKLKEKIDSHELSGLFLAYPLLDEEKQCLWPEKFTTADSLNQLRQSIPDENAWNLEYLLIIAPTLFFRLQPVDREKEGEEYDKERQRQKMQSARVIKVGARKYVICAPTIDNRLFKVM